MDDATAARYLSRIGADTPAAADSATLADLMERHLFSVPFENLSIHLGEPIMLDEAALLTKLVDRRRGGFCYELNGAFAALLQHVGYPVTMLAARVFTPGGLGPLFDHLVLRVDTDVSWLVDVGFGRLVRRPVRLAVRTGQQDAEGVVLVSDADAGDLVVHLDQEPQIRIEMRPRQLDDFVPTCWYHQTSPRSHFTRSLTCSLPTADGRITLSDRMLIRTSNGDRLEQQLDTDDEVLTAYANLFGISLDRLPAAPAARQHS